MQKRGNNLERFHSRTRTFVIGNEMERENIWKFPKRERNERREKEEVNRGMNSYPNLASSAVHSEIITI